MPSSGITWPLYEQIDQARRWLGTILDAVGLAPLETPSRVVLTRPGVVLRAYANGSHTEPVLLLVPAPIKRAYIWDLVPWASVVQQCLRRGVRVYLIQWEPPDAEEQEFGLAEYADRLIVECLDAIEAEIGQRRVFLAGHSLGGTMTAIFSALHPERVQGLALIAAPLHFGSGVEAVGSFLAVAPWIHRFPPVLGNVPGSFLNVVAALAAPATFGWSRLIDWLDSLPDAQALQLHMRIERWTLDEMPLPRRLFDEIVELLYREDRFLRGTLLVRGQRAAPELIDAPILSVVNPRCSIAPPESVLPFHRAARIADTRLLWYEGDTGVAFQHVGVLVGKTAHQHIWPEILSWIHAHRQAAS